MFVYCVTTTPFPARISITCANRSLHFDTAATTSDTCTHDRHHSPVGNLFDAVELKVDFVERLVGLAKPLPHALVAVEDACHPLGRVPPLDLRIQERDHALRSLRLPGVIRLTS